MMRSGAIKGAGPFFSGREPDVPAIQSYPHAEANLPTRYPTHRKQRGGVVNRRIIERVVIRENTDTGVLAKLVKIGLACRFFALVVTYQDLKIGVVGSA
jgi:hypothetical protein